MPTHQANRTTSALRHAGAAGGRMIIIKTFERWEAAARTAARVGDEPGGPLHDPAWHGRTSSRRRFASGIGPHAPMAPVAVDRLTTSNARGLLNRAEAKRSGLSASTTALPYRRPSHRRHRPRFEIPIAIDRARGFLHERGCTPAGTRNPSP